MNFQLGDIYAKYTPYTLYNNHDIYHDYEADIFEFKRDIINYENFYFDNQWRMQGVEGNTRIGFDKGIKGIDLGVVGTRTISANGQTVPDRFLTGTNTSIDISDMITIGGTMMYMFDDLGTASDSSFQFKNIVGAGNFKVTLPVGDKIGLALVGEGGGSNYDYEVFNESKVVVKDFFIDGGLEFDYKPKGITVSLNYRNVGPQFSSPSAQTRRFLVGQSPLVFSSFSGIGYTRSTQLLDRIDDPTLYNHTILPGLMEYLPQYNNIEPYGKATPNRQGLTASVSTDTLAGFIDADVIVNMLGEVVREGATQKRSYFGIKGGARFHINKLLGYDKKVVLIGGYRSENTSRSNDAAVSLSTMFIDYGLTLEAFKRLDVMLGGKMYSSTGNEFVAERQDFNEILGFQEVLINESEHLMSLGMRYNFAKYAQATVQYFTDVYKENDAQGVDIAELYLGFLMKF